MNGYGLARIFLAGLGLLALAACGERPIDVEALKKSPRNTWARIPASYATWSTTTPGR